MRWLLLVAGVAVAMSVGLVTTCGGGNDGGDRETATATDSTGGDVELSLGEYFQRIDGIFERSDRELDDLNRELQTTADAADTLEEEVEALEAFANASADVLSRALSEIDGIDEPAAVDEAHKAFVSAIGDALTATERLQDDLDAVQSAEELELVSTQFGDGFSAIQLAADAACNELQAVADGNGIGVDLNCED